MTQATRVGVVAGRGRLPFEAVAAIKESGHETVVIGLAGEAHPELAGLADRYYQIEVTRLGEIIDRLLQEKVSEVIWAGKVGKEALFNGDFDPVWQRLLADLPHKNDDAVLGAVLAEFERRGLTIVKQTAFLSRLLAQPGSLVGTPTAAEWIDLRLGFEVAKAMGGLDIGQSVVVKAGVILAVEAMEGTDQAIRRGGALGGPGAVVVKVSKPRQDERFDLPTIGRTTLEAMLEVRAGVLGIESGKTLVTERTELLRLAEAAGIKLVAFQDQDRAGATPL